MLNRKDVLCDAFKYSLSACDLEEHLCSCKGTGWMQYGQHDYICCPVHYAMQPCPKIEPLFQEAFIP